MEQNVRPLRRDVEFNSDLGQILKKVSPSILRLVGLPISSSLFASMPKTCRFLEKVVISYSDCSPLQAYETDSPKSDWREDPGSQEMSRRYSRSRDRWYSALIRNDDFVSLPKFDENDFPTVSMLEYFFDLLPPHWQELEIRDDMPPFWGLRSLSLCNIPRMGSRRWDTPLAKLLSCCPLLTELALGASDEFAEHWGRRYDPTIIRADMDTYYRRAHGAYTFFYSLCYEYFLIEAEPLKLAALRLYDNMFLGTSPMGIPKHAIENRPEAFGGCDDLPSAHPYLEYLVDLTGLKEVRLSDDRGRYGPFKLWGIGTFNRRNTLLLRSLSVSNWTVEVKKWVQHSDPSFLQQVALIAPQEKPACRPLSDMTWTKDLAYLPRMLSLSIPGEDLNLEWVSALQTLERSGDRLEGLSIQILWASSQEERNPESIAVDLTTWTLEKLRPVVAGLSRLEQLWIEIEMTTQDFIPGLATWMARTIARSVASRIKFVAVDWKAAPYHVKDKWYGREQPGLAWRIRRGREAMVRDKKAEADGDLHMSIAEIGETKDLGAGWRVMTVEEITKVELFRNMVPLMVDFVPVNDHIPRSS